MLLVHLLCLSITFFYWFCFYCCSFSLQFIFLSNLYPQLGDLSHNPKIKCGSLYLLMPGLSHCSFFFFFLLRLRSENEKIKRGLFNIQMQRRKVLLLVFSPRKFQRAFGVKGKHSCREMAFKNPLS